VPGGRGKGRGQGVSPISAVGKNKRRSLSIRRAEGEKTGRKNGGLCRAWLPTGGKGEKALVPNGRKTAGVSLTEARKKKGEEEERKRVLVFPNSWRGQTSISLTTTTGGGGGVRHLFHRTQVGKRERTVFPGHGAEGRRGGKKDSVPVFTRCFPRRDRKKKEKQNGVYRTVNEKEKRKKKLI